MKYVSIDIETTGTDPDEHDVIEVGAIIDDFETPYDELPRFRGLIFKDEYVVTPFCAALHSRLWDEIFKFKLQNSLANAHFVSNNEKFVSVYAKPLTAMGIFQNWLAAKGIDVNNVLVAGKCFEGFDKQFLERMGGHSIKFSHRSLDPTSFWVKRDDLELPSTSICCKRAGIELADHHTALGDALTVIKLLRAQMAVLDRINYD